MPDRILIVLAMFAVAGAVAPRAVAQAPSADDRVAQPAPTEPPNRPVPADSSTADDILNALRRKRPQNEVIQSVDAKARGDGPRRLLMPEGARVVDLTGQLTHEGIWWQLTPPEPSEPPVRLLPNNTLEGMVRSTAGADEALSFIVSGEMTVFQGENYLLPRLAARANATANAEVPPSTEVLNAPADAPLPPDATVEQVLDRLKELKPEQEVITGYGAAPKGRLPGLASGVNALIPEGTPLVSRPGRLIVDGSWWTFVFESDHPDHPEPPIKLLPNQNLDHMTHASEREANGLVFVISGEVTAFDGENYLLTRSAIRRVELGNLQR